VNDILRQELKKDVKSIKAGTASYGQAPAEKGAPR